MYVNLPTLKILDFTGFVKQGIITFLVYSFLLYYLRIGKKFRYSLNIARVHAASSRTSHDTCILHRCFK